MNIIVIILTAFVFSFVYSFGCDIYELIKTRVKRRRENKNADVSSDVL